MGRRRGVMSEQLKYELAKDLGFYETVMQEGWEGIRTKDAGNLVKRAIQIAEEKLAHDYKQRQQPQQQPSQSVGQSSQRHNYGGQQYRQHPIQLQQQQPYQQQPYRQQEQQGYQSAYRNNVIANSGRSGLAPTYPSYPGFAPPVETGTPSPYLH